LGFYAVLRRKLFWGNFNLGFLKFWAVFSRGVVRRGDK
jgi:hypothetical protein